VDDEKGILVKPEYMHAVSYGEKGDGGKRRKLKWEMMADAGLLLLLLLLLMDCVGEMNMRLAAASAAPPTARAGASGPVDDFGFGDAVIVVVVAAVAAAAAAAAADAAAAAAAAAVSGEETADDVAKDGIVTGVNGAIALGRPDGGENEYGAGIADDGVGCNCKELGGALAADGRGEAAVGGDMKGALVAAAAAAAVDDGDDAVVATAADADDDGRYVDEIGLL
jgi:hypothetical protein